MSEPKFVTEFYKARGIASGRVLWLPEERAFTAAMSYALGKGWAVRLTVRPNAVDSLVEVLDYPRMLARKLFTAADDYQEALVSAITEAILSEAAQ